MSSKDADGDENLEVGRERSGHSTAKVFNVDDTTQGTTMLVLAEHTGHPVVVQLPLGGGVPQWDAKQIRTLLCAILQEIAQVREGRDLGPPGGGVIEL